MEFVSTIIISIALGEGRVDDENTEEIERAGAESDAIRLVSL